MRVGIEVGGTFTDLVAVDQNGLRTVKVPSTPAQPDIGAMDALYVAGIDPSTISELVHGSTVATNAVLERKGARICLFVTKGTRDILLLQRHDKRSIYDLHYKKPQPVVRRRDIFEIEERLAPDGSVIYALDKPKVTQTVTKALENKGYEAVAICFLHSYAQPRHELSVAAIIKEKFPNLPVTCSSDVAREFREYERASTTSLAAYVQPVISNYIARFSSALISNGFRGHFSIMQSNGGRMPAEAMARNAITALFSGPAAGVVGAVKGVKDLEYTNIITLDMGGTSTDVSLIAGGRPDLASMIKIDGLPVKTPVIDIVTVGAGGGSIVWRDDGGLLRVGPLSAGAIPGPVCYMRGGKSPTITDAHLIRGTLRPETFLGGKMAVDGNKSLLSFNNLSEEFNLKHEEIADSAIRLAEANIVRAIQQVSTERGRDPREYVLVPFGGAGPLHAARVAEELNIQRVVVPVNAGVLSASGLLLSDYLHFRSRTYRLLLTEESISEIRKTLAELYEEARNYITSLGIEADGEFERILEMRYVGQAFEIPVSINEINLDELSVKELFGRFTSAHQKSFEFRKPEGDPIEVISFKVGVKSLSPALPAAGTSDFPSLPKKPRFVKFFERGMWMDGLLIIRQELGSKPVSGPALIEDGNATVYVPPGWNIRQEKSNVLILNRGA